MDKLDANSLSTKISFKLSIFEINSQNSQEDFENKLATSQNLYQSNAFSSEEDNPDRKYWKDHLLFRLKNSKCQFSEPPTIDWKTLRVFCLSERIRGNSMCIVNEYNSLKEKFGELLKTAHQIKSKNSLDCLINGILSGLITKSEENETEFMENLFEGLFHTKTIKFRPLDQENEQTITLKGTLIIGEEGGIFLLLNRVDIILEEIQNKYGEMKEYLNSKIKKQSEGSEILIGKGGNGVVRLALCLVRNEFCERGQLICVKKIRPKGNNKQMELSCIDLTILDYFKAQKVALRIDSPNSVDMAIIKNKKLNAIKGYVFMELLPQNNAQDVFKQLKFQSMKYIKPYLLDVLCICEDTLSKNIFFSDLKPENTLFDVDLFQARFIDLGCFINIEKADKSNFESKPITQYTIKYWGRFLKPSDLLNSSRSLIDILDLENVYSNICGKIIIKFAKLLNDDDDNKKKLIDLGNSLEALYIKLNHAIITLKGIEGIIDEENNAILCQKYIDVLKEKLKNDRPAIDLNEDIVDERSNYIVQNLVKDDPSLKSVGSNPKDLKDTVESFFQKNTGSPFYLLGDAGSGKSIALQNLFIDRIKKWKDAKDPLPVFFNMARCTDLEQFINDLNNNLKVRLKLGEHQIILFADSFDKGADIGEKKTCIVKKFMQLIGSNSKLLITCRSNFFKSEIDVKSTFINKKEGDNLFYLSPLAKSDILLKKIIEKWLEIKEVSAKSLFLSSKEIFETIEQLNLKNIMNTSLLFNMIIRNIEEFKKAEGRIKINSVCQTNFDKVFNENIITLKQEYGIPLFNEYISKLKIATRSKINKNAPFAVESTDKIKNIVFKAASRIANEMLDKNSVLIRSKASNFLIKFSEEAPEIDDNPFSILLRLLPLKIRFLKFRKSNSEFYLGFKHDLFKIYFLNLSFKREIKKWDKPRCFKGVLKNPNLINQSELIRYIAEDLTSSEKQKLMDIMNSTRDNKIPLNQYVARNAITILVAGKYNFSKQILSNLNLEGAILKGGIFNGTVFYNVVLKRADLSHTYLRDTKFVNVDLSHCTFGPPKYLKDHKDKITIVKFSPCDKIFISCSLDKRLIIWDKYTLVKKKSFSIKNKNRYFEDIAYHPEGQLIALVLSDYTLILWEYGNKKTPSNKKLRGHTNTITSLLFSMEPSYLISSSLDKTIKIWSLGKYGQLFELTLDSEILCLAYNGKNEKKILACGVKSGLIRVWLQNSNEFTILKDLHTYLAIYDNKKNKLKDVLSQVYCLEFTGDSNSLISGTSDNLIIIWDPWKGQRIQTINAHSFPVVSLLLTQDSEILISASSDGEIKFWNFETRNCLETYRSSFSSQKQISYDSETKINLGATQDGITCQDTSISTNLLKLEGHDGCVSAICFSPDGQRLASESWDKNLIIWNLGDFSLLNKKQVHERQILKILYSRDGKLIITSSFDGFIKIIDSNNLEIKQSFRNEKPIIRTELSNDMKYLIISGWDNTVKIWEIESGNIIKSLPHHDKVFELSISSDNSIIISGTTNTVKIWAFPSGNPLQVINDHKDIVQNIDFDPNGNNFSTCSKDKLIYVYEVNQGSHKYTQKFKFENHSDQVVVILLECR